MERLNAIVNRRYCYTRTNSNSGLMVQILEMFPDACPFYIKTICLGKSENPYDMDNILRQLLHGNYPKREGSALNEESFEENLNLLESIFPDADPNYLHYHAVLYLDDKEKLLWFIDTTLEKGDYPLVKKNQSTRKNGKYYICNCCYDDEVKARDLGTCGNGCVFCKSCIQRSVEIAYGEGRLHFPCLSNCSVNFSLHTLEDVLPRKLFDKIAEKKQIEEVKAAQIENLEVCPFCDFAMIPGEADKTFRCQKCLKESCRLCKQMSHLPLHCDEVTKPDELQRRLYIENKMSEALIRVCYKCHLKFIKSEGCNRMKCTCGAMMCYLCCKPVTDYTHFNGPGGDKYHLCPLFSDMEDVHEQNIANGVASARLDILLNRHLPQTTTTIVSPQRPPPPTKSAPKPPIKKEEVQCPPIPLPRTQSRPLPASTTQIPPRPAPRKEINPTPLPGSVSPPIPPPRRHRKLHRIHRPAPPPPVSDVLN